MIHIEQLAKTYQVHQKEPGLKGSLKGLFRRKWLEKHALRGVSLHVGAGEIVGLIGANGAGKTTLVKACAGIIKPTSGEIKVLGFTPFDRANALRRQISLIMGQKQQLWWDLPAADGFLLLREIYLIPKSKFQERLDFLAKTLGVEGQLTTPVRKLSLGERMKMELIAALLHEPKVVFLDEPTIGLDLTAQRAIRQFLRTYQAEAQPAMLLTSHYMEDIEKLCERIVIIREGEVVFDGKLREVMQKFTRTKVVKIRLASPLAKAPPAEGDLRGILPQVSAGAATFTSIDPYELRLSVRQERVTEVSALLLQEWPVEDLAIEEEDIGTVIEAIMREGLGP